MKPTIFRIKKAKVIGELMIHCLLIGCFLGTLGFAVYAPFNIHRAIRTWQWWIISPVLFITAAYAWNQHYLFLKNRYRHNQPDNHEN